MEFSIKNFFSKCDQICSLLQIWSHLMKKSLMENFIFLCSVCKTAENEDVTLVNVSNFGDGKIGKKREISLIKIFLIRY